MQDSSVFLYNSPHMVSVKEIDKTAYTHVHEPGDVIKRTVILCLSVILLFSTGTTVSGQSPDGPGNPGLMDEELEVVRHLVIGTKTAPPFSIKNPDGSWSGISIELWKEIALRMNVDYEFREYDLVGLLNAVENGDVDVGIAAISVTSERELVMDFSHPYFTSGLGIAVPKQPEGLAGSVKAMLSTSIIKILGALFAGLLIAGIIIWSLEKKHSETTFSRKPVRGISDGFWWAAVTLTSTGYGDKVPATCGGRIVAIIWMFAGIFFVSTFTAVLATAFTTSQLQARIHGPEDLDSAVIGAVAGATTETYLIDERLQYTSYATLPEALDALSTGEIDAVVHDAPILSYIIAQNELRELAVLGQQFDFQAYAIALPSGSPLEEEINRALLLTIEKPEFATTVYHYLGGG